MFIDNPPYSVDYVKAVTGEILRPYIIPIGVWNMDTTAQKDVAHTLGVGIFNCKSYCITIISDSGTQYFDINYFDDSADPTLLGGGLCFFTSTAFRLRRRTGGMFDNNGFDDAVMNRGFITLWISE
jgi:hypothetical protein